MVNSPCPAQRRKLTICLIFNFSSHTIQSDIVPTVKYQPEQTISLFIPLEIAFDIGTNIILKKASRYDMEESDNNIRSTSLQLYSVKINLQHRVKSHCFCKSQNCFKNFYWKFHRRTIIRRGDIPHVRSQSPK